MIAAPTWKQTPGWTYELGKVIVDDFYNFYDELKSYYNSIEYGGSELFDLGNLSALLSVVNAEVSEDHMDEADCFAIIKP